MDNPIIFESKTDRELLLLVAQKVNDLSAFSSEFLEKLEDKADKKVLNICLGSLGTILMGIIIYVLKHIGFPQS